MIFIVIIEWDQKSICIFNNVQRNRVNSIQYAVHKMPTKMSVTLYLSPWLSKLESNANHWERWIKRNRKNEQTVNNTRTFHVKINEYLNRNRSRFNRWHWFGSREFMCNAQVKRTSKNNHFESRISRPFLFEGWFPMFLRFFFPSLFCWSTSKFRKGKFTFQKINDLLPATYLWSTFIYTQKSTSQMHQL